MMSTIDDVARLAGVSKSTVSNAITGKKFVSSTIKNKVFIACEELNFVPNFFATNVANNNSGIVGLFLESGNKVWYEFYNDLLSSCITQLSEHDIRVIPYFGLTDDEILHLLQTGHSPIMGAIVLSPHIFDSRIQTLQKEKLPFVLIGQPTVPVDNLQSVDVNNMSLTYKILQYVVDKGHKKIWFANSNQVLSISQQRDNSVLNFLSDNKDIIIDTVHLDNVTGKTSQEYLKTNKDYTCIITASDIMAYDIYQYAQQSNITIGKELSIIAFGGQEKIDFNPLLTIARQDYKKIGVACCKQLLKLLEAKESIEDSVILVTSNIVEGTSVATISR